MKHYDHLSPLFQRWENGAFCFARNIMNDFGGKSERGGGGGGQNSFFFILSKIADVRGVVPGLMCLSLTSNYQEQTWRRNPP